jgi:hypothetical protein
LTNKEICVIIYTMSLEKAIHFGKEYRKPYYRASSVSSSCRPHGGCPICLSNRIHSNLVRMMVADETADDIYYPIKGRKILIRNMLE